MTQKYVLVLCIKTKKTGIVFEEAFVKSFGGNGKEIPITEGTNRVVSFGDKRFQVEILRISASKKYLESLLVTEEGKILLHGSKPPCGVILARRGKLFCDEPEDQKSAKNILRTLNSNAEEQQPNTRLDSASICSHGCPSCCSGTLPPFPTIPEGFINTVVSLAEYFHQFHKSSIANIIAAGHASSVEPEPWLISSPQKVELVKDFGVWINSKMLEKIVTQVEISKKAPHQTLVKTLLTHLLGINYYIDTPAEKMDRRLVSAVIGFVNTRYPEVAQPPERFYRTINLNRSYLLKRKNEGALDDPSVVKQYSTGIGRVDNTRKPTAWPSEEVRIKFLNDSEAKKNRKSANSVVTTTQNNSINLDNVGEPGQIVIPLNTDVSEVVPVSSSNNVNKIIVLRRPATNSSTLTAQDLHSNSVVNASIPFGDLTNGTSTNRTIVVSSTQANTISSNLVPLPSASRPSGNFPKGLTTTSSSNSSYNESVRSTLPVLNRQNQFISAPVNSPAPTTSTTLSKPYVVPTSRVLVSVPNPVASSSRPVTSTVNGPLRTYAKQTAFTLTSTSSNLSANKTLQSLNVVQKLSSAHKSAVSETVVAAVIDPSGTVLPNGLSYSKAPRVPSPDIVEIPSGLRSVPFKRNPRLKEEKDFEIEGALNISL